MIYQLCGRAHLYITGFCPSQFIVSNVSFHGIYQFFATNRAFRIFCPRNTQVGALSDLADQQVGALSDLDDQHVGALSDLVDPHMGALSDLVDPHMGALSDLVDPRDIRHIQEAGSLSSDMVLQTSIKPLHFAF